MTKKIFVKGILTIAVVLMAHCNNYDLLGHLENPGGRGGASALRRIFVTNATHNGGIGGISVADAKCLNDSNNPLGPGNGNWKAMVVDGSARRSCTTDGCSGGLGEQIDWVLKPNTTYTRPDGTIIATTNPVGLFTFPLENAIAPLTSVYAWTGLNNLWQTTSINCVGWTDNTSQNGTGAEVGVVTSQAIYFGTNICSSYARLYCVEQ